MLVMPKLLPLRSRRNRQFFGDMVHWNDLKLTTFREKNSKYKSIRIIYKGQGKNVGKQPNDVEKTHILHEPKKMLLKKKQHVCFSKEMNATTCSQYNCQPSPRISHKLNKTHRRNFIKTATSAKIRRELYHSNKISQPTRKIKKVDRIASITKKNITLTFPPSYRAGQEVVEHNAEEEICTEDSEKNTDSPKLNELHITHHNEIENFYEDEDAVVEVANEGSSNAAVLFKDDNYESRKETLENHRLMEMQQQMELGEMQQFSNAFCTDLRQEMVIVSQSPEHQVVTSKHEIGSIEVPTENKCSRLLNPQIPHDTLQIPRIEATGKCDFTDEISVSSQLETHEEVCMTFNNNNLNVINDSNCNARLELPDGTKLKIVRYVPPNVQEAVKVKDDNNHAECQAEHLQKTEGNVQHVKNSNNWENVTNAQGKYSLTLRRNPRQDSNKSTSKWLTTDENKARDKSYTFRYLTNGYQMKAKKKTSAEGNGNNPTDNTLSTSVNESINGNVEVNISVNT